MKNERKEELKDEMKNRISMALKDPTLQQGFEIICKNLKELGKENAETKERIKTLEYRCENIKDTDTMELVALQRENAELEKDKAYTEGQLDEQIQATLKLQKENAELKEQKEMLEKGYVWHDYDAGEDCYEDTHEGKWVKRDEVYQLTKAKDLLKRCYENYIYLEPLRSEIEQFLNSEVEKCNI